MQIVSINGKKVLVRVDNKDLQNGEFLVPEGVTSIGGSAFFLCTGLTNITIPDSITSIADYAFSDCRRITYITIPASVTSIGKNAFQYCTSLTGITIPDSVTSIGDNAFFLCTGLTNITIPAGVTSIADETFNNCTSLIDITIPASVTSIGRSAFDSCTRLTSVTLPPSVTSIGNRAFSACINLACITIPASVNSIGDKAFYMCTDLTRIAINTCNSKEIDRIRNLLPENLQDLVMSENVFQRHQEILNRFCSHYLSTEKGTQISRIKQMRGIVATFNSRDYPEYHRLDMALRRVSAPAGDETFDTYSNQLEQLLNTHMGINKGISKLKSYIQLLEKEIPIDFLKWSKRPENPKNKEILETRFLAKQVLSYLKFGNIKFEFSPADRDLLDKKPLLMAILSKLPEDIQEKTGLLEDYSESREMKASV